MGLQPYKFIRVENADVRAKLREVSSDQAQITDASEIFVITSNIAIPESDVVDFVNLGGALRGYKQESMKRRVASIMKHVEGFEEKELAAWNARQAYIAIGQLLTAAAVMGIDACPMEGIDPDEYNRILGLNSINLNALAVVALGFRSEEDELQYQPKVRKPLEELIITV
jgi:nitroreductase